MTHAVLLFLLGLLGAMLVQVLFACRGRIVSFAPTAWIVGLSAIAGVMVAAVSLLWFNWEAFVSANAPFEAYRTDGREFGIARILSFATAFVVAFIATDIRVRSRRRDNDAVALDW